MLTKALIFAAGLGTRLQPLTLTTPKALVTVAGKTLLEHQLLKLKQAGITHVVINIHHLGQQIVDFVCQNNHFGLNIQFSDETQQLLDTGGGLVHAAQWLQGNQPFLVCNADILSDIDLAQFYQFHRLQPDCPLATLAVQQRASARQLLFNQQLRLCGWQNTNTGEVKLAQPCPQPMPFAFSGFHIIEPAIFALAPTSGVFSIINLYLQLAAAQPIAAFVHQPRRWFDVGTPQALQTANEVWAHGEGKH